MMLSERLIRFTSMIGVLIVLLIILFGYLFFEPYLTEKEITIKVLNKAAFGKEPGKYFVFTQDEVFYNSNNYYHNKDNADYINEKIYPGSTYKVKVVGIYLPWLPRFRNITEILKINDVPELKKP